MATRPLVAFASVFCIAFTNLCVAHPGRTDSSGGHNDRKNGGYHYHGGGSSSSSSAPASGGGLLSDRRTSARVTARYEARTEPPQLRTSEARTYQTEKLGSDFLAPPVTPESPPAVAQIEKEANATDEVKARKLLDYAKRQYLLGKVELGMKWVRWVLTKYSNTVAASEAKILLEEWKKSEPFKTWKDASGKFSTVARFVRLDDGNIYLQNETGKTVSFDIKRLSRADQEYVIQREDL